MLNSKTLSIIHMRFLIKLVYIYSIFFLFIIIAICIDHEVLTFNNFLQINKKFNLFNIILFINIY